MKSTIQQWGHSWRTKIINSLRPGRDKQELLAVVERAEAIRSENQRWMLEKVVEFDDIRVREIMVPRSAIHAVTSDTPLHEMEMKFIKTGVSRLPVMDGDLDHILGVVHFRDLAAARAKGEQPTLTSILRRCLRVSELEQASGLLDKMESESCHVAIVHDEYGGTAGLVTLINLLAEIVGDFRETGDGSNNPECTKEGEGSYIVRGRTHVDEFEEEVGVELPAGDYDTVAGMIVTTLGRIPAQGEVLEIDGLKFVILQADPRRITKVRVLLADAPAAA